MNVELKKGGISVISPSNNKKKIEKYKKLGFVIVENKEELKEKTVKELEEIAKERGLSGYSDLKKAELIELLKAGD